MKGYKFIKSDMRSDNGDCKSRLIAAVALTVFIILVVVMGVLI